MELLDRASNLAFRVNYLKVKKRVKYKDSECERESGYKII